MKLPLVIPSSTLCLALAVSTARAEDGHNHAAPASQPAKQDHAAHSHAGHDHGHDDHDDHDDHGDGHGAEVVLTAAAIKASGIRIGEAKERILSPTLVAAARVSLNADAMAHIGSIATGRAVELKVRLGDVVKKDDELVVVESPELGQAQSDFLQKRSAVTIATKALEPTRQAYERAKALQEKSQGISVAEMQKREGEWIAAQGAIDTAKAALAASDNTLRLLGMSSDQVEKLASSSEIQPRFVIRAPIAGTVIEREVTMGELVSPEKESLLVLANLDQFWVIADVPEARLAEIALKAKAIVESAGAKQVEGVVDYIAPMVDPQTRSGKVRIEVKADGAGLRLGMFAKAIIATGAVEAKPVVAIPAEAVQTIEGQTVVFVPVEGEANTFAKRDVEVGKPADGLVAVQTGLQPGERVVVAGSFVLKAELGKSEASHEH